MKKIKFDVTSLINRRADHPWDRIAVGDIPERITWSRPNQEALVSWQGAYAFKDNERLTYKQLNEKANQFANALLERGLKRGDRIVTFALNSAEHYISQLGTFKAGMVLVPINVMLADDVVSYIIKQTEPSFSVVEARFIQKIEETLKNTGIDIGVTIPIGGDVAPGSSSFDEFIDKQSKDEPDVRIHGDDIAEILYTSGTTAWPRGAMISHVYLYFCAISHALTHSRGAGVLTELDYKIGIYYPIFHIAAQGMMLSAHITGGTAVMTRLPTPQHIVDTITREKLTSVFGSPADFAKIAEIYEKNPGTYETRFLRTCSYGWGPLPPSVDKRLREIFGRDLVILSYDGQTECVYDTRGWHHKFYDKYEKNSPTVNYLGMTHPFYATKIVDEDMNTCPPGVVGEKVMRSPVMMAGYYKNEEATEKAFSGGWLHSGDACKYDENGLIIMVDRIKDIIKSRGESISTIRVENALMMCPKVERAAVFGVPHRRWGEAVVAAVVLKPGETATEQELIDFCRAKLAGFETPRKVVFLDQLPTSVGTKVKKYELRERYKDLFETGT